MLKESLLAGIALIALNPIQAAQTIHPQHTQNPVHHEQMTEHHDPAHPAKDTKHCPPCPCGGVGGWVLIPAGPGTSCNQNAAEEKTEEEVKPHHRPAEEAHRPEEGIKPHHRPAEEAHKPAGELHRPAEDVHKPAEELHKPAGELHKPAEEVHKPAVKPSLHPLPTPEEEALAEKLKPIAPHIFRRADPNHPNAEKKGEWGKSLDGKVYFRVLGIWKHDPSVHATTDIIPTGVKDRVKTLNEASQKTAEHTAKAALDQ